MKRRLFIKQSAILSASFITMPELVFTAIQKTGLQLYTLRDIIASDVPGVFNKIKKAGYSEVEMYGLDNENKFFGHTVKQITEYLKASGLTSSGGHYSPDNFLYKKGNGDDVKNLCDVANELGNNYIIIPWLNNESRDSIDKYKILAERMNLAGEICKKEHLQLTYHNHDFEFENMNGQHGYDILLNYTDSNLVKMEMDLYWVVRAGYDPVTIFKAHPGRFPLWHIKDMDKNDKTQNTEVGNGLIDFKKIFAMANVAGIKHFIVEQENNYKPDIWSSIITSNKMVKRLLQNK
ncbi:MAG TPA: sugar phosphate isomerase/epimerase [Ferruginibacter sp.]|nr:sugar phosphate isomerase/epimerase [Ferruginibacter sp.]